MEVKDLLKKHGIKAKKVLFYKDVLDIQPEFVTTGYVAEEYGFSEEEFTKILNLNGVFNEDGSVLQTEYQLKGLTIYIREILHSVPIKRLKWTKKGRMFLLEFLLSECGLAPLYVQEHLSWISDAE